MTERDPDMELDCTAVIADVWLLLDNECDQATRERLQHHMDHCSPCIEAFGIEEKIKGLLSRKCGGDRAPDSLRDRLSLEIRRSVTVTRVETSE
ncbi:mycothiol system anti-sigma-R factor [Nocardia sp. NBC_00565]|uniref:mycothiol system anti-sigma-R factor n=1 Tax=Nocardia sp. NBC_00565 TaxID=2975993 RepID=UPI002E80D6F2|nr:mycothiol system anti-sigma-R factor [Nocardia sp. NBC_00565]WUC00560.1 mycothiol system anti-sigma-R factor [Nocardia sp. NBC_00565]